MENRPMLCVSTRTTNPLRSRTANAETDLRPDGGSFGAITDFTREYQLTVRPELPIHDALITMICGRVHALVVTQEANDSAELQFVGLVTLQAAQATLRRRHRPMDTLVRNVMTPWTELPVIHYESLRSLTMHDLYERFRGTGLTHFLIVESVAHDYSIARGLVSRAALGRRLQCTREAPKWAYAASPSNAAAMDHGIHSSTDSAHRCRAAKPGTNNQLMQAARGAVQKFAGGADRADPFRE